MAEVPPGVVTVTSTVPVPAGEVARDLVVELMTVTLVAAVVAEVDGGGAGEVGAGDGTVVPPAVGPVVGLTAVTVGAAS